MTGLRDQGTKGLRDSDRTLAAAGQVTRFCAGQELFKDWPERTLFTYCFFHLAQGCCFTSRSRGRIRAVMFAWQTSSVLIQDRARRFEPVFQWRTTNKDGDAIFVGDVVADGRRRVGHLMSQAAARWPRWEAMRVFTFRRGTLIELEAGRIKRLMSGQCHGGAWSEGHGRGKQADG